MAISDRTRKLLWGRAGERCAICRKPLSRDPEHGSDRAAVLGEECHIVGRSRDGPRGMLAVDDLDGYENLILLCANDHAIVDAHAAAWDIERLRQTKTTHEQWVAARLAEAPTWPDVSWRSPNTWRVDIETIRSGSRLMSIYECALSVIVRHPERLDRTPRELVGSIFRTAEEWSDLWDDVRFDQRLEIEADLDEELDQLAAEGFMVLGGVRNRLLKVDGRDTPWPEGMIFVRSDAEIQAMLDETRSPAGERSRESE